MRRAPSGYKFSRDEFDAIGRGTFGQAWTGDLEYRARSGLWTIAEYERAKVTPGSGMSGSGAGGVSFAPSLDDPASLQYQAEREARHRYVEAEAEFIARLEDGQLMASVLDTGSGEIKPVVREFWRTKEARQAVRRGIGPGGQGTLLIIIPLAVPDAVGEEANRPNLGGAPRCRLARNRKGAGRRDKARRIPVEGRAERMAQQGRCCSVGRREVEQ
jgi:hypothetical protein